VIDLSVITVSLNAAATIARTIDSVRAQTGALIEHIVVDGGSTDGTMEIVMGRRQGFAQVVCEPDRGLYDAMNKGLALARGKLTGFLNADDAYASPNALRRLIEAWQTSKADAVYGDVLQVDAQDRPLRMISGGAFSPDKLRRGLMPPHPSFYARTALLREAGGFNTDYAIAADFDLVTRTFAMPDFQAVYVPTIVANMRVGGVSTRNLKATRIATAEILKSCRANGIDATPWSVLSRYPLKAREVLGGRLMRMRGYQAG
jgi:glycosyltransferase involved in cell wall biosynthesis